MKELFSNKNKAIPIKVKADAKAARLAAKRAYKLERKKLQHKRLSDWSKNRTQRKGLGLGKTVAKEIGKTARTMSRNATEASIARSENMTKAINAARGTNTGIAAALNQEVIRSQGTDSSITGSASKNTSMNYDNRLGDDK